MKAAPPTLESVLDSHDEALYRVTASQPGPSGSLPLTASDEEAAQAVADWFLGLTRIPPGAG